MCSQFKKKNKESISCFFFIVCQSSSSPAIALFSSFLLLTAITYCEVKKKQQTVSFYYFFLLWKLLLQAVADQLMCLSLFAQKNSDLVIYFIFRWIFLCPFLMVCGLSCCRLCCVHAWAQTRSDPSCTAQIKRYRRIFDKPDEIS